MAQDYNPATQIYSLSKNMLVFDGQRYHSGGVDITGNKTGDSTIGPQIHPAYHIRASLEAIRDTDFFQQIADTITMPKNSGKEVTMFEYYPVLDDRNQNDQGLDATGARYENGNLFGSSLDVGRIVGSMPLIDETGGKVNRIGFTRVTRKSGIIELGLHTDYTEASVAFDTDPLLMSHKLKELMIAANEQNEFYLQIELLNSAGITMYAIDPLKTVTASNDTVTPKYIVDRAKASGITLSSGTGTAAAKATAGATAIAAVLTDTATVDAVSTAVIANSTLEIGRTGDDADEQADADDQALADSFATFLLGVEQADAAGTYSRAAIVNKYTGDNSPLTRAGIAEVPLPLATAEDIANNTGYLQRLIDEGFVSVTAKLPGAYNRSLVNTEITYQDFVDMEAVLDDNNVPMDTDMITGTRMIDTKTVRGARTVYCGTKTVKMLRRLRNNFGEPAFLDISKYGAGAKDLMKGEVGRIDGFRIIRVRKMLQWSGAGATASGNVAIEVDIQNGGKTTITQPASFYSSTSIDGTDKFDVFPILFVGKGSFSNIGMKTFNGKGKFNMIHKPPGPEAATRAEPFGKGGFMSIQWWMGMLVKRPEHIAVMNTIAPR